MPVMPDDVLPADETAATTAMEPLPAEEETGGKTLPEPVLKIPAVNALLQGAPPATYGPLDSKLPEVKTLTKYAEDMKTAGFAAFKSVSMPGNFVLFNGLIIKPDEVMQADKSGQLDSVAVPFEELVKSFDQAKVGAEDEAAGTAPPAAPAGAGATAMAAPMSSAPPAPAGAQKRLMSARVSNLAPGSPTSGPAPGRGRVLNAISKPVV